MTPVPPAVGPARITLKMLDGTAPVRGATLRLDAQMSHPGMAPVMATAVERGNGLYDADLDFTMAGDWIVLVEGSLPDGRRVTHRIDLPGVGAR